MRIISLFLFFCLVSIQSQAATNHCDAENTTWAACSWSLGHQPLESEDVTVTCGDGKYIYNQNNVTVASLSVTTANVANHDTAILLGGNITVTGTFTMTNNNTQIRPWVTSTPVGTQRTITAATVSITGAVDFRDIKGAGDGSWDLSSINSGNLGGNSGITFKTPRTLYAVGADGKQDYNNIWSTSSGGSAGGATVFPLPQDTMVFDNNSFASTGSDFLFHYGGNSGTVDASGLTKATTLALPRNVFGSLIYTGSGITLPASNYTVLNIDSRLKNESGLALEINITPTVTTTIGIVSNGGIIRLTGDLTETNTLTFTKGNIDLNGNTLTLNAISKGASAYWQDTTTGGSVIVNGSEYYPAAASNVYYVKTGGNDSAAGTSDGAAWAHCPGMAGWTGSATLVYGDTVYFRGGDSWDSSSTSPNTPTVLTTVQGVTYDGITYGTGARAKFVASYSASASGYGIIKVYTSNVTLKGIEVDGSSIFDDGIFVGLYGPTSISNIVIDDCYVHDIGDPEHIPGETGEWPYGILISASNGATTSNVEVKNCEIFNVFNDGGISIYPSWTSKGNTVRDVSIHNNNIHDCGLSTWASAIDIPNHSVNITVENNTIHNNGHGVTVRVSPEEPENIIAGPTNIVIRYNIISGNAVYGFWTANGTAFTETVNCYYNQFIDNGDGDDGDGADLFLGSSSASDVYNIYNNTIYTVTNANTNWAGCVLVGLSDTENTGATINFKNNIVYAGIASSRSTFVPIWDRWGTLTHSNNLVYRTSDASDVHIKTGTTNRDRAYVQATWEPTSQITDPEFVAAGTNFRLSAGSHAIDAGTDVGLTRDYLNHSMQYAAWDIGAYEYFVGGLLSIGAGTRTITLGGSGTITITP